MDEDEEIIEEDLEDGADTHNINEVHFFLETEEEKKKRLELQKISQEHEDYIKSITMKPMDWLNAEIQKSKSREKENEIN